MILSGCCGLPIVGAVIGGLVLLGRERKTRGLALGIGATIVLLCSGLLTLSIRDFSRSSAIEDASCRGDLKALRRLLADGPPPEPDSEFGHASGLNCAMENGHFAAARLLVDAETPIGPLDMPKTWIEQAKRAGQNGLAEAIEKRYVRSKGTGTAE